MPPNFTAGGGRLNPNPKWPFWVQSPALEPQPTLTQSVTVGGAAGEVAAAGAYSSVGPVTVTGGAPPAVSVAGGATPAPQPISVTVGGAQVAAAAAGATPVPQPV